MKRRAKIVATIGPKTSNLESIMNLIVAGTNVFRINMSHGEHCEHQKTFELIREASKNTERHVAILCDLQGPKIRVDKLKKNIILESGQEWVIGETALKEDYPEYKDNFIPTVYKDLTADVEAGQRVLFDDGLITAVAVQRDRKVLKIKIDVGGTLKSNKGINLPDTNVTAPSFTDKDRDDFFFAARNEADYVALSFVRKSEDVKRLKHLMSKYEIHIPVVSKIERREAVENIDSILEVTDVVMVARGDMGVEIGNHAVPSIQKDLIRRCNLKGVPVITATQMLESMIKNSTPTRAEASDVANAIWDGTDAVMLSGETAVGDYPIETVSMMKKIIIEAEKVKKQSLSFTRTDIHDVTESIMLSAALIGDKIEAKKLVCFTDSAVSAKKLARFRPETTILGVAPYPKVMRRMCLYWGVVPFLITDYKQEGPGMEKDILNQVKNRCHLEEEDLVVITRGGGDLFEGGMAHSVRVERISID